MNSNYNDETSVAKRLFGNQHISYLAQYGWQKYLEEGTFTFGYIFSYKEAADRLVEQECPDLYILPIMFCYRHYLELLLKNICVEHLGKDYADFLKTESHSLKKMWNEAKKHITINNNDMAFVGNVILNFHKADPSSMNFRYEMSKKQKKLLQNDFRIDTYELKLLMEEVDRILRHTYNSW